MRAGSSRPISGHAWPPALHRRPCVPETSAFRLLTGRSISLAIGMARTASLAWRMIRSQLQSIARRRYRDRRDRIAARSRGRYRSRYAQMSTSMPSHAGVFDRRNQGVGFTRARRTPGRLLPDLGAQGGLYQGARRGPELSDAVLHGVAFPQGRRCPSRGRPGAGALPHRRIAEILVPDRISCRSGGEGATGRSSRSRSSALAFR